MRIGDLEHGGSLAAGIVVGLALGLTAAAVLTDLTVWQLCLSGALAVVMVTAGAAALRQPIGARRDRRERRSAESRSALVVLGSSWLVLDAADGEVRGLPAALGVEPWMSVAAAVVAALGFALARRAHR